MAKFLTPKSDLLFKVNSKVKDENNNNNNNNHFRKHGGKEILAPEEKFTDSGLHVCGKNKLVLDLLDLIFETIKPKIREIAKDFTPPNKTN